MYLYLYLSLYLILFQVGELATALSELPMRALLAAAFVTYLSNAPEDARQRCLDRWMKSYGVSSFNLRSFLSTESEQLIWKGEGLPSDSLSMENAMVILQVIIIKLWYINCYISKI